MKTIQNEKGLALIGTLIMLVLGFGVVVMMLRMVTAESKLSRLEQNYTSALDAGKAGTDVFIFMVENNLMSTMPNMGAYSGGLSVTPACLDRKLKTARSTWDTPNPVCSSDGKRNTDATPGEDLRLTINNYTVYVKVVDTVLTDPPTDTSDPCYNQGCYYYTVQIRSMKPGVTNTERSDITFVYRFPRS